jgi:hypothetical protein
MLVRGDFRQPADTIAAGNKTWGSSLEKPQTLSRSAQVT